MTVSNDLIAVNCGTCGKRLILRIEDIKNVRIINCADCEIGWVTRKASYPSTRAQV